MTALLKHLDEVDEEAIPLLLTDEQREEQGLFSEEEIRSGNRRKWMCFVLKMMIPFVLLIIFLMATFKTYRYISYDLRNQKIQYKLNSISVKDATEKGFALSINATVDTNVPWSLDLKGLNVNILDKKGNSILSSEIPDFKFKSGEFVDINLLNQSVKILNSKALAELINKSVPEGKAKIPVRIKVKQLHPHWIPYTFKDLNIIDKVINLDFKGKEREDLSKYVKLVNLQMEESANDDLIITAKLSVTNPFPFSIDKIPPISFKIFYSEEKVFIGKLRSLETIRLRKNSSNFIKLQGHLSPSADSRSSDAIRELVTNHLLGRSSRIYLQGDDDEAAEKLNWLQSFLIHLNIPIDFPGKSGSGMFEDSIKKIDIKRIFIALDPKKPNQIELDSDAEVHFHVPRFASMMKPTIESLTLEGKVSDQQGNFLAPLSIPNHQVGSGLTSQNSLNTSMRMNINVNEGNVSNIETLMAEMLYAQDTTVSVSGHSSLKTKMFLGRVTVPRVPFAADIKLPGLGAILSSQNPEIKSLKVKRIAGNEMVLSASISINNPLEITSLMGAMHLNCILEESRKFLGVVLMKNAAIRPGTNELEAEILLKRGPIVEEFIGNYLSGQAQGLILQGVTGSETVHPILKNVIGAFVIKATLKPEAIFGKFVSAVTLKRKGFNLIPEAYMTVSNPFQFPIKILSVHNLRVFAYKSTGQEVLITEMDAVPLESPIIIPANVSDWIDEENPLPMDINGNILRSIKALELLLSKENPKDAKGRKYLPTRIEGRIKSEMESMQLEFTFIKDRLPLYLEL